MFWQIRRDFLSLFTRGNNEETYLHPVDGLRSIASICITSLHLIAIFNTFILPYPHAEWNEFLHSKAFAVLNLLSFSLEIFLMLSSFLLTLKLIKQWKKIYPNVELFFWKTYPISIVKRAFRFWPGILLATLILMIFGEPFYPNSTYFFEFFRHLNLWMFFQNYINSEYWYITFTPLWSISLDMQAHLILPFVLYFSYSMKKYLSMTKSLSILLIISIIRGIIVFNPVTMPIETLGHRYPSLAILCPPHLNEWLEKSYNLTFNFDSIDISPLKLFLKQMYLPFEARFGSFIIGSILAIQLLQTPIEYSNKRKLKKFIKYLSFFLIFFQMLTMIQGAELPPSPPSFVLKLAVGCSRQLFTIGQSFLLFTVLCPQTHPYYSSWLTRFLSLSFWIPISKLSYLVYLIHLRLAFGLIFGGPLRILKIYSVTYATLISLPILLILSQCIASLWYVFVQKPSERALKYYLYQNKFFQISTI